ncbi:MAG: hypothetical protein D3908_16425, partial [Candidatus Electrothrix sp. AUS4]|nr:hypothetical protein [Candidatus Electrothrix sp. AUS4]
VRGGFGKGVVAILGVAVDGMDSSSICTQELRELVCGLLTEIAFSDKQIGRRNISFLALLKNGVELISFVNRHSDNKRKECWIKKLHPIAREKMEVNSTHKDSSLPRERIQGKRSSKKTRKR